MSTTTRPARRKPLPPATCMDLIGDRVICAFCGLADHAVRFIAEDVPLCEDCEAHRPELWEGEDE